MISCPLCGSTSAWRNGHKPDGRQRYLCRNCGREYVERHLNRGTLRNPAFPSKSCSEHDQKVPTRTLNKPEPTLKLVSEAEKQEERLVRGGTDTENGEGEMQKCLSQNSDLLKDFPKGLQAKILEFIAKHENQGYKSTGEIVKKLRLIQKAGGNLYDPESVKKYKKHGYSRIK